MGSFFDLIIFFVVVLFRAYTRFLFANKEHAKHSRPAEQHDSADHSEYNGKRVIFLDGATDLTVIVTCSVVILPAESVQVNTSVYSPSFSGVKCGEASSVVSSPNFKLTFTSSAES